jgi:hypothetical protein
MAVGHREIHWWTERQYRERIEKCPGCPAPKPSSSSQQNGGMPRRHYWVFRKISSSCGTRSCDGGQYGKIVQLGCGCGRDGKQRKSLHRPYSTFLRSCVVTSDDPNACATDDIGLVFYRTGEQLFPLEVTEHQPVSTMARVKRTSGDVVGVRSRDTSSSSSSNSAAPVVGDSFS